MLRAVDPETFATTRCGRCAACSSRRASSCRWTRRPRALCAVDAARRAAGRARLRRDREAAAEGAPALAGARAARSSGGCCRSSPPSSSRSGRRPRTPSGIPRATCGRTRCRWSTRRQPLLEGLEGDRPRKLAVMLGALCHDLGKPPTTRFEDGRVRSRGHEEAGLPPTESLLDRWNVHTLLGYDLRAQVLALVAQHLKPGQLYDDRERVSDGAIRRLARKCEADLLYRVARADCLGRRPGPFEPVAMEWFKERVQALDVAQRAARAAAQGPRPAGARPRAGAARRPRPAGGLREAARRRRDDARGRPGGSRPAHRSRRLNADHLPRSNPRLQLSPVPPGARDTGPARSRWFTLKVDDVGLERPDERLALRRARPRPRENDFTSRSR